MESVEADRHLEKLCALAKELLGTSITDSELPAMVESYADAVDALFSELGEALPAALAARTGTDFLSLHAQVLAHTELASKDTTGKLRDLKKHGRGILAYTDILPKRLGVARPRRG